MLELFLEKSTEGLHADLTRAVVRSSDWMKQFYEEKTTKLRPYRAASMFATLRIAGHYPSTLLTDFKDGQGNSIDETLKNKLKSVKNLLSIPSPQLGLIIQGVISICKDPKDFHGYNLIKPLLAGFPKFKTYSSFNNYFGYSLAVIALCNAGNKVPDFVIKELVEGANRKVSYHSVDTNALISTALSCVSTSNRYLQHQVDRAIGKLIKSMISKQNTKTGAFGNQYTTALAVEVNIYREKLILWEFKLLFPSHACMFPKSWVNQKTLFFSHVYQRKVCKQETLFPIQTCFPNQTLFPRQVFQTKHLFPSHVS